MKHTLKITTPTDREILITRTLDAPRRLVWDAMTKPEHVSRWMVGPPGWATTACENDLRVGGTFRHAWKNDDGREMSMHGVYREVVPHERIVRTETFDVGCVDQMGEQLGTMTFVESGGRTTVAIRVLYPTKEARDGMLASGMEHGMEAGYARLDEILSELQQGRAGAARAREA